MPAASRLAAAVAVTSLAAAAAPAADLVYAPGDRDPFVGMNLWKITGGGDPDAVVAQVEAMHAQGYRQVNLIPRVYVEGRQDDSLPGVGSYVLTSAPVAADPLGEETTLSDDDLRAGIRRAKQLGMHVSVTPHLTSPSNAVGRAEMRIVDTSVASDAIGRSAFWTGYGDSLVRWAGIAEQEGADRFNVGSELTSLASDRDNLGGWDDVLTRVDAAFGGRIGYQELQFAYDDAIVKELWSHTSIDYVALSAYLEVERYEPPYGPEPKVYDDQTVENVGAYGAFVAGKVGAKLGWFRDVAFDVGKPLVLEELGTTAINGASGTPYIFDFAALDGDDPDALDRFSDPEEMLGWYQGVLMALDGTYGTGAGEIERANLWTWAWQNGYAGEPFGLGASLAAGDANLLASEFLSSFVSQPIPEPTALGALAVLPAVLLRRRR